jgi:hypothetical protein
MSQWGDERVQPWVDEDAPWCVSDCPSRGDDDECKVGGHEAEGVCLPAVKHLVQLARTAEQQAVRVPALRTTDAGNELVDGLLADHVSRVHARQSAQAVHAEQGNGAVACQSEPDAPWYRALRLEFAGLERRLARLEKGTGL